MDEARTFLDLARMIDNKIGEVDDAKALMWADVLADVDVRPAIAAMKEHYRTSTETILPSHVRPMIKRLLATRADMNRRLESAQRMSERRRAIESGEIEHNPVAPTREEKVAEVTSRRSPEVSQMIAELRKKLGPGRPSALRTNGAVRASEAEKAKGARANEPQPLSHLLNTATGHIRENTSVKDGESWA